MDVIDAWEKSVDLAVIRRVEACFHAVEKVEEAVIPGGIDEGVGELDEALQPLGVGHLLDVAEVRLRGFVKGGDDFCAVGRVVLGGQGSDKARGRGEGVVEVVDIGQQVGLGGGHAIGAGAAADPAAVVFWRNAGGAYQ